MNEKSLETASTTTPVAVIPPRCPITPHTIRSTTTIPTTASEPILETTTSAPGFHPRSLPGCSCSCSGGTVGGSKLSELASSTTPTTTDDDLEERKYIFKMKLNYYNIYLVTTSYRKERRFSLFFCFFYITMCLVVAAAAVVASATSMTTLALLQRFLLCLRLRVAPRLSSAALL